MWLVCILGADSVCGTRGTDKIGANSIDENIAPNSDALVTSI